MKYCLPQTHSPRNTGFTNFHSILGKNEKFEGPQFWKPCGVQSIERALISWLSKVRFGLF